MSGMTGYDQTASYSSAAQYNYVPNLHGSPSPSVVASAASGVASATDQGGLIGPGHQVHQWHQQYQPHHQMQQANSNQRYSYYDSRSNGYYAQHLDSGGGNWHEPVTACGTTSVSRPDSPGGLFSPQNQYSSCKLASSGSTTPGAPGAPSGATSGNTTAAAPPSPSQQQQQPQKSEPNSQQHQYSQYQCPPALSQSQIYNNNLPPPPPHAAGPTGPPGGPHQVHNSYPLSPDLVHGGQPSPVGGSGSNGGANRSGDGGSGGGNLSQSPQGGGSGGGGSAGSGGNAQNSVPSAIYPWMRSQFGKNSFKCCFISLTKLLDSYST